MNSETVCIVLRLKLCKFFPFEFSLVVKLPCFDDGVNSEPLSVPARSMKSVTSFAVVVVVVVEIGRAHV